jgi:acyl carrier protein
VLPAARGRDQTDRRVPTRVGGLIAEPRRVGIPGRHPTEEDLMDTASAIREYIQTELIMSRDASLRDDTPLWGGVLDSVGLMQLITFIEERFEIEVGDDELTSSHFGTVGGIAALVDAKVSAA